METVIIIAVGILGLLGIRNYIKLRHLEKRSRKKSKYIREQSKASDRR